MSKSDFETRFETAHANLNKALKDLEKTMIDKLHETASQSRLLNVLSDENSLNAKVNEQIGIIQNLTDEINKLHESVTSLGNENDVLVEENNSLREDLNLLKDEIRTIKNEGLRVTEIIEQDLERISAKIAGEKHD